MQTTLHSPFSLVKETFSIRMLDHHRLVVVDLKTNHKVVPTLYRSLICETIPIESAKGGDAPSANAECLVHIYVCRNKLGQTSCVGIGSVQFFPTGDSAVGHAFRVRLESGALRSVVRICIETGERRAHPVM